eukprot:gene27670-36482_t
MGDEPYPEVAKNQTARKIVYPTTGKLVRTYRFSPIIESRLKEIIKLFWRIAKFRIHVQLLFQMDTDSQRKTGLNENVTAVTLKWQDSKIVLVDLADYSSPANSIKELINLLNKINIDGENPREDFLLTLEKVVREIFHSRDVLQAELDALVVTSNKQLLATNRKIAALEKEVEETKAELLLVTSNHMNNNDTESMMMMPHCDLHSLSSVSNDIDVIVGRGTSTMGSPFYSHMFVDEAKSPLGGGGMNRGAYSKGSNRSPMNGQSPMATATRNTNQMHLSEVEKALELKTSELESVWDRNIELHAQVTELKSQLAMAPSQPSAVADIPEEVSQFQRKEVTKRKSASIISMFKNISPIRKESSPALTATEEAPVYNPEDILKIVEQNAELQAEIGLLSLASDNHTNTSGRLIHELEDALQSTGSELQSLLEENSLLKKNVQVLEDSLSAEKEAGEQKQAHVEALQAELDRTVLLIQDLDTKICSKAFELDELHDICRQYAIKANEGTLSVRAITTNTTLSMVDSRTSVSISKEGSEPSDASKPNDLGPKSSSKELAIAKSRIAELEKENRTMKSEIDARKEKSGDFVEETEKMIKTIIQENNALQSEFESFVVSSNKKLKVTERRVAELESELQQKNQQLLEFGMKNKDVSIVVDAQLQNLGSELDSNNSATTTESFLRQRLSELEKLLETKTSELGSVWERNIELHAQITDLKTQVPKSDTKEVPDTIIDKSVPYSFSDSADSKRPKSGKKRSGSIISMFKNLSPVRKASAPTLTTEEDKEDVPVYNPEDILKIVEQNAELQAEIGLLSLASDNHTNSSGRVIHELEDALQSTGSELQSLLEENSLLKKNVQVLEDSLSAEKEAGEQKQAHVEALQAELDRTVLLIQDLDTKICSKAFELDELHDICRQYAIKANEGTLSVRANTTNIATNDISASIRSVEEIEAQILDLKKFNMVSSLPQLLELPPVAPTAVQSAGVTVSEPQVGSKSFASDVYPQFDIISDNNNGSKLLQGPYTTGLVGTTLQEPAPTSSATASDNSFGDLFNFSSILGIPSNKPILAVESGPPPVESAVLQQNIEAIEEAWKQKNDILLDQINIMKAETNNIATELGRILNILDSKLGKAKVRDLKVALSDPKPLVSQGILELLRSVAALIDEMSSETKTTRNGSGNSRLSISGPVPVVTSSAVVTTTKELDKVEQELKVANEKCAAFERQASQTSLQLDESKQSMNELTKSVSNYRKILEEVYREQYIVANQIKMSTVVLSQGKASKFLNANPSNLEEDVLTQCTQLGDSVSSILDQLNEHDRMLHKLREDVLSAQADTADQVAELPATAIETATSNDSMIPDFNSIFSFTGFVPVSSPVAASTPTAKSAPPSSVSSPRHDLRNKVLADQCKSLEQDNRMLQEQKVSLEQQLSETIEELTRKKDLELQLSAAVTSINQKRDLEQQVAAMTEELAQKKELERQLAAANEQIQNIMTKDLEQQFLIDSLQRNQSDPSTNRTPSSVQDPPDSSLSRRCEKLESDSLVLQQQKNDLEQQLVVQTELKRDLEQQMTVLAEELAQRKDLERQLAAANEQIQNITAKNKEQQHHHSEPSDSIVPGLNAIFSFGGLIPTDPAPITVVTPSFAQDPPDSSLSRRCEILESDSLVLQQQKNDLEQQLVVELALKRDLEKQLATVSKELKSRKVEERILSTYPPPPTQQDKKELSSSLGSAMFKLFREDTFSAEGIKNPVKATNTPKSDARKKAATTAPSQARALKEQNAVSMPQLVNTTTVNLWTAAESNSSTSSIDQAGSKLFEADIFSPIPDSSNSKGPLDKQKQDKQLTIEVPSIPTILGHTSQSPEPAVEEFSKVKHDVPGSSALGLSTQLEAQLSPATRIKRGEDLHTPTNTSLAYAMQQIDQLQTEIRAQEAEQRKMTEQLTLYRDSSAVSMKVLEENLQQSRRDNDRLVQEKSTLSEKLAKVEKELIEWTGKHSTLEKNTAKITAAIDDSKSSLARSLEDKIAQQELTSHDIRIEVRKLLQKVTTTTTTTTTTTLPTVEGDWHEGFAELSAGIDRLLCDLKGLEENWNMVKEEMMLNEEEIAKPASANDSIIPDLTSFWGSLSFAAPSNTAAPVAEPATALTSAEQRNLILQKIRKLKQENVEVKQHSQPNPTVSPSRVSHSAQTDKEVQFRDEHIKKVALEMQETCLTISNHLNLVSSSSSSTSVSTTPDRLVQQYSRELSSAVAALIRAISVQQNEITSANNAVIDALLEEGLELGQRDNIEHGYAVATAAAAAVSAGHKHLNLDALNKLIAYYKTRTQLVDNAKESQVNANVQQLRLNDDAEKSKKIAELYSLIENKEVELQQQRDQYEFKLRDSAASAQRDKQIMQQQLLSAHSGELASLASELQTFMDMFQETKHLLMASSSTTPSTEVPPLVASSLTTSMASKMASLLTKVTLARDRVSDINPSPSSSARREIDISSQKIVDLEARIDSLRSTIAVLDTTNISNPAGTSSRSPSPLEGVKVAAMEASLAELKGKFQQQYENLTNIISDMAEERNRLVLQTLDLQMKCDFQQSELQEQQAQMEDMRRLQLTIATSSSSSTSVSATSCIQPSREDDDSTVAGRKAIIQRFMEEKAALQSQVQNLKSREMIFREEKAALLTQISVMKAMRMRKLKVSSQRMAATSRLGLEEATNNFYTSKAMSVES